MKPEDHREVKWLLSYLQAKFTPWGQIIFGMVLIGFAISSVGTQISAYFLVSLIWALFITTLFFSSFFKPAVSVTRKIPPALVAGGYCLTQVIVTNVGKRPLRGLGVFDHQLPYGIYAAEEHESHQSEVPWLEPGQQAVLTLVLRIPRRGTFQLQPVLIGSHFPTGLIRSLVKVGNRQTLVVFPRIIPLEDMPVRLPQRFQPHGSGISTRSGTSNEFLSTREYREGDRMRDIHWKSSARAGQLIVKEYIEENVVRVGIFLDIELKRFEKHRAFETRLSACAGLVEVFVQQNYFVDVFVNDSHGLNMQIGRDKDHFYHFLEMLSAIDGDSTVDFSQAQAILQEQASGLSQMVLFLKDWNVKRQEFVRALRETNCLIRVIIIGDQPVVTSAVDQDVEVYGSRHWSQQR